MPVFLPFTVFLASLISLIYVIRRRFMIIKRTIFLQKELELSQKQLERAEKKQKVIKEKALKEIRINAEKKHKALRSLGVITDLMKKADRELVGGETEEALKTLIQVIALDDHHRKANELMADIYFRAGQYKKSDLLYKKLVELFPFDPNYLSSLGQCYLACHQFKAAIKYFEQALTLDKNNPSRMISLGQVYAVRKEYTIALEFFLKAHKLDIRNIELMFLIIETCLQNSDPITAREFLHKILDYEPYNQEAKTLLGEVLRGLEGEEKGIRV